jgi:hypothetical protein
MAFWWRLLEGTSWQDLVSYVSPAFFQIVSPRDVSHTAYRLARNWFDERRFLEAARFRSQSIEQLNCGLTITTTARRRRDRLPFHSEGPSPLQSVDNCRTGEKALTLFFHQIHTDGPIFLDLRRRHFRCIGGTHSTKLAFITTPLYGTWSPHFRGAIQQLYGAFYGDAPNDAYLSALGSLGIEPAADLFEKAFGGSKRTATSFRLSEFRVTFHEIFMRCLQARCVLEPDFLTLGIAIATLYDHLELDGGTYNVAECYARGTQPNGLRGNSMSE